MSEKKPIGWLLLGVVLAACGTTGGGSNEAELDELIKAKMQEARVPGLAACVVKGGRVAWCKGYGLADVEAGREVTADTPFLLASVSKVFTATAVLQRWEQGDFELDDAIDGAAAFAIEHPSGTSMTYRQLLAHVAGIADSDVTDEFYTDGADPTISLEEAIRGYFTVGGAYYSEQGNFLAAPPGTQYAYSNMGYALAGYLVEVHAGQDFAAWCNTSIFEPLGLDDTSWRLADFGPGQVALPYAWNGADYESYGHFTFADYPNGGLRSSARSVATYLAAIANGGALGKSRILEAATVELMFAVAHPGLDATQGLGFFRRTIGGETWVGHDGGEDGTNTAMFLRPADGLGYVILMNGDIADDPAIQAIEARLITFGEALSP